MKTRVTAMLLSVLLLLSFAAPAALAVEAPAEAAEDGTSAQAENAAEETAPEDPAAPPQEEPAEDAEPGTDPQQEPAVVPPDTENEEMAGESGNSLPASLLPGEGTDALAGAELAEVYEKIPFAALEEETLAGADVETAAAPTAATVKQMMDTLSARQVRTVTDPTVSSTGGEWTVLGLARSWTLTDAYKNKYLGNLYTYLDDKQGVLAAPGRNYTEYSRVILALAAIGEDAGNVAGYDLIARLAEYDNVVAQGVNGAVWALIALDSRGYQTSDPDLRGKYIQTILNQQISGGGWNLLSSATATDPDISGMVLQALAPYYTSNSAVKAAVDTALAKLGSQQKATGDFGTCEANVQMLVGLNALGISIEDSRFVKGGRTLYDALMDYYDASADAFRHSKSGSVNQMATDQALCALTSLYRSMQGLNRLYDMSDAKSDPPTEAEQAAERAAIIKEIKALPKRPGIKNKSTINLLIQRLKKLDDFDGKAGYLKTLEEALAAIKQTEKAVAKLDKDIWNKIDPKNVTLKNKSAVKKLMKTYKSLSKSDRDYLKNTQSLLDANTIIQQLEKGVIPKLVFTNIKGGDTNYKYTGTYKDKKYTLTVNGEDVTTPAKMKAGMLIGTATAKDAMERVGESGYWFHLKETKALPAKVKITLQVDAANGRYTLYRYKPEGDVAQKISEAKVEKGKLTFSTTLGGDFFLYGKAAGAGQNAQAAGGASGRSSGSGNGSAAKIYDGTEVIEKSVFEGVQGKDENVRVEGKTEDGVAYRLTFNGENVDEPMDFDPKLAIGGKKDGEIGKLAERPFILHFAHSGLLPGKMLVEVESTLPDGEYLLFYYNEKTQKAEMIQGVEVADGWASFFISHCSDYFIAKRALKSSVAEILAKEAAEREAAQNVEETAAPAAPKTAPVTDVSAPVLVPNWPLIAVIVGVAACALGVFIGLLVARWMRQKETRQEEMARETG